MLLLATLLILAAFGATTVDLQPSALRVAVTAVVAVLAPLCWPGSAAISIPALIPTRTALRIAAWSAAAACVAAIALRILGSTAQPWSRIAPCCLMLLPILLVTHAAAAGLEGQLRSRSADAHGERELAGRTVAIGLALLGALPLWLGPAAELLSDRHAWLIDAVIGASPLTHLAVASGNDLLRNQWFYQHSNLAALRFSYPGLLELAMSYAAVCALLALLSLVMRRSRRLAADAAGTLSNSQRTQ